ncbi:MAG: ATP synthase F1 subunit delta [Flavobacteriaceae bacterium]
MTDSRAALRYAKAVLDLAIENKASEGVEQDMRAILATISGSSELREMLASPIIKGEIKKKAIEAIFPKNHKITKGLVNLLVGNRRISMLNEVAIKYIILNEKIKGQNVAYVTTAVPMSTKLEDQLLKKVEGLIGNKVSLENKIDESIIGGFVLRIGDLQYDASIANKLDNLKREFTKSL